MRLLIATSNPGKAREFRQALAPAGFEVAALADFPHVEPAEESAGTFAGNARLKAEACFEQTRIASLADDSGLAVDALQGRPGVRSARLANSDPQRIRRLLEMIHEVEARRGPQPRDAHFACAICLILSDGRRLEVEGRVDGTIIDEPRGELGFGYDPIFFHPPLGKTFAELTPQEKNQVSHRARALEKLRRQLKAIGRDSA